MSLDHRSVLNLEHEIVRSLRHKCAFRLFHVLWVCCPDLPGTIVVAPLLGPQEFGNGLFHPTTTNENRKREGKVDIEQILGKQDWVSMSPQTQQQSVGLVQMILQVYESGAWDKIGDVWQSALLPEGKLVTKVGSKSDGFLVVRATSYAALVWPMVRRASSVVGLDLQGSQFWARKHTPHCKP